MSSSNRTTSKGGKGPKADKSHKNEKGDTGKGTNDKQQGGGGGDNARSKSEDPTMRDKVRQVMEFTNKTEEDVCLALHECDNNVEEAMDMLLDDEWGIMVKKKKSKQPASSKTESADTAGEDWNDQAHNDKEKPRNKSGGPPRLHRHNDSRGWRGREKQENERNLEGGNRQDNRDRRGRSGGPTRGGPGRGRGGSRVGSRYPPRNNRNFNSRPIETWDNNPSTWDNNTVTNHSENWDDGHIDEWSTEEYTGSLADTKVFTPSIQPEPPKESEVSRSPLPEERTQMAMQQGQLPPSQSPIPMVGTLNAAQTQYLSQLTQQNTDMKTTHLQNQTYGSAAAQASQQYTTNQYGGTHTNAYASTYNPVSTNYGTVPESQPTQQPLRTKTQRARVPPPSKIPSSAVEMPGDLKSIGLLDVQFGAMDLISDGISFDGVTDSKFNSSNSTTIDVTNSPSSNIDLNTTNQTQTMDTYASQQKTNAQSNISSALTQSLTSNDNIPQTSEHLTTGYSTATRSNMAGSTTSSGTPSTMELNKQQESHSYSQSSTYNSYQPKSSSYQTQNYSSTPSYSTTQTTSSYGSSQPNNYVSSNTGSSYNPPASNTYQNNSSASSYQSNYSVAGYPPSITQASSYPTNNQAYSQSGSQSVYGANSGLTNSSNYGNTTTSPQYNSYSSNTNHKLVKDNAYDNTTTAVSSTATSTTSVSTSTSALSLTQTTATATKTTTTTLAKNSSGVVSNIPPGVAPPVMSTPYIMSQGIPYFQPPMYTYEDMQLLPHRIPHMTTPFYEMSYQTPTTMTAVRDQPLSTYTMSDARFTRGDNNASPVPSTLSQQTSTLTQGHQGGQPILTQTPQTYFFATPYSPMQSYQFGAVYGQIPAATNAHGSSNSTQYPKPYGSGYGSAYDTLGQSQDYTKGGYVGNTQGQSKGTGANASSAGTTGNDLSAMYSKSHTAIGKVNSYDKQGFHSGTPPPFSGTLHGSQNAGLAPSGSGYGPQMYIPTMPPHQQHHSTQLMHQQLHQMDVRQQGRRMDSGNTSGQRSQASNQAKSGGTKYPNTYWTQP